MRLIMMGYHKCAEILFDRFMNNAMKAVFHNMRFQKYENQRKKGM